MYEVNWVIFKTQKNIWSKSLGSVKASMGPGALPSTLLPPNDPKILERERTKDK
jgi:hypothetical protein